MDSVEVQFGRMSMVGSRVLASRCVVALALTLVGACGSDHAERARPKPNRGSDGGDLDAGSDAADARAGDAFVPDDASDVGTGTGLPAACRDMPADATYCSGGAVHACADAAVAIECGVHASCESSHGEARCTCDSGYHGDGGACESLDFCARDNGGCDPLTTCKKGANSSECGACPKGYVGDARTGCIPGLTGLEVSPGTLQPDFDPLLTAYSVTVPLSTKSVSLTARAAAGVSIQINDDDVKSGKAWASPPLALGDNAFSIVPSVEGHATRAYSVTVTRSDVAHYIKPSMIGSLFGRGVALSQDTLVVSASDDNKGAVYVFVRGDDGWREQARLTADNAGAGDHFGNSLAIDGDTLVVGAPLEDGSGAIPSDEALMDSGAAYVFVRSAGTWSQQAYLKAPHPSASDGFGLSVAIAGDTLVIGSPNEDSAANVIDGDQSDETAADSGAGYVFVRSASSWSMQAYLKPANNGAGDGFGGDVAISGDTIAISAPLEDSSHGGINPTPDEAAQDSGAVYVFTRSGSQWSEQAYLKADHPGGPDQLSGQGDNFGWGQGLTGNGLAIWGDTLAIGAPNEDSSASGIGGDPTDDSKIASGAVYVFVRDNGVWSEQAYIKASHPGGGDGFGVSVALWSDRLVVGAHFESSDAARVNGDQTSRAANSAGAAYVFERNAGAWTQRWYLKSNQPDAWDLFGTSVAVTGHTIAVGATQEDGAVTGVDATPGNENAPEAGAAYLFE